MARYLVSTRTIYLPTAIIGTCMNRLHDIFKWNELMVNYDSTLGENGEFHPAVQWDFPGLRVQGLPDVHPADVYAMTGRGLTRYGKVNEATGLVEGPSWAVRKPSDYDALREVVLRESSAEYADPNKSWYMGGWKADTDECLVDTYKRAFVESKRVNQQLSDKVYSWNQYFYDNIGSTQQNLQLTCIDVLNVPVGVYATPPLEHYLLMPSFTTERPLMKCDVTTLDVEGGADESAIVYNTVAALLSGSNGSELPPAGGPV